MLFHDSLKQTRCLRGGAAGVSQPAAPCCGASLWSRLESK